MHLNVINNYTFVRIRFSIISSTSCKRRIRIFLEMSPQNRGPMSKQVWHNKRSLSAPNLQHFISNGDVTILEKNFRAWRKASRNTNKCIEHVYSTSNHWISSLCYGHIFTFIYSVLPSVEPIRHDSKGLLFKYIEWNVFIQ